MAGSRRITVGFHGGQALAMKLSEQALAELEMALGSGGWHSFESEDGPVRLDLGQVVYVTADSEEPHVGFG